MAWAAPVASVVTGIGGALIGRSGQNRALSAQERAATAQLQYQREQDANRARRYDSAMTDYRAEKAQYDAIRRAVLGHYGINLPDPSARTVAGPGASPTQSGGMNLEQLVGVGQRFASTPRIAPGPTDGSVAPVAGSQSSEALTDGESVRDDVFDWRNYGVS